MFFLSELKTKQNTENKTQLQLRKKSAFFSQAPASLGVDMPRWHVIYQQGHAMFTLWLMFQLVTLDWIIDECVCLDVYIYE